MCENLTERGARSQGVKGRSINEWHSLSPIKNTFHPYLHETDTGNIVSLKKKYILEGSSSVAKFPIQKLKKNSSLSMIVLLLMVAPATISKICILLLPVACDASKVAYKNKAYLLYRLFGLLLSFNVIG